MRTRKSIIALCLVLVAAMVSVAGSGAVVNRASAATVRNAGVLPSAGCGSSSVREGEATLTTMSGGVSRTYIRRVPAAHDGVTPRPLIIDLHGLYQGAALQERNSDWAPRGSRRHRRRLSPRDRLDLEHRGRVARRRVLRTTARRDRSRAVHRHEPRRRRRLLARCLPDFGDRLHLCRSHRGRRADRGDLHARPVAHRRVRFPRSRSTGRSTTGSGTRRSPGKVAAWAARNGCGATPTTETVPGDDVVNITKFTYDCPASAEVEFYSIENGGHAWPGSEFSRAIEAAVGYTTFAINATDLIWDFFRTPPAPSRHRDVHGAAVGGARCLSVAHRRGQREVGRRSRAHRGGRVGRGRHGRACQSRHRRPRSRTTDRSGSPSAGRRPRRPASMPRPQPGVSTATPSTTWVDGSWPASCSWLRSGGCKEHRERRTRIVACAARADRVARRDRRALSRRRVERAGVRRPLRRLPEHREHCSKARSSLVFENDARAAVLPSRSVLAPARCSATTRMRSTTPRPFVPT